MKQYAASTMIRRLPEQYFSKLEKSIVSLKSQGADIINLAQGSPDQPTPDHIIKSLQEAATDPQFHRYSPFQGFSFFKEAVAEFYKNQYDVDLDPNEEVCILFGGKGGLVEVSQCLLNRGDVALVPDPGYPDYWSGVAMQEANMHMMPLRHEHGFLPQYEDIPARVRDEAKLLFLNYPNNPTGAVASSAFFEETVRFANDHDICTVHDFAYGAISFDGVKHPSFMQTKGAKENGIEIYTLSKTYNMAGWRVGFAVGNRSVIKHLNVLQDHQYVSLFGAVQRAATTALTSSQAGVTELQQMYEKRRNVLVEEAKRIGWAQEAPKGSFFAWFKVPNGMSETEFATQLLHEAHVAVAPGNGFGEHGRGYVRIGLVNDETKIKEAMSRIEALNLF
ncbi:pyridoxal phosphate-dependent aminotransferase [Geomicrobium sp. JSM 1781026]|uniref:pyridoxal phosphate-dependent aminotransferase n=1 Tax=Geomicrobium sp. JSM 1781026 TaxID=3344580 RepID=UPI0035C26B25